MIRVVLDTSILKADPIQTKPETRALEALAIAGRCQIIIPEIVKREFLSQREEHIDERYETLSRTINGFKRDPAAVDQAKDLEELNSNAQKIHKKVLVAEKKRFDDWVKKTKAKIAPYSEAHANATLDAYFDGKLPFIKRRERKDLPDSLIFESVKGLPAEKNSYVVVNDGNLANAIKSLGKHTVCSTLQDFVKLEEVQREISKIESEKEYREALPELISFLKGDLKFLDRDIRDRISKALDDTQLHDQPIPEDNGEARIMWEPSIVSLDLDLDDHQYLGGGTLVVPFSGTADAELNFAIYKSDYMLMDDEEAKNYSISELNDHYFDAEMNGVLEFEGYAEISVEKYLELKKESEAVETVDLVDGIEIEEVKLEETNRD